MAIAALHGSFENLMMERQVELVLRFRMAAHTKLWFGYFQQLDRRDARFLSVRPADENIRTHECLPVSGECDEWHSVQPMSLRQCSPRRKLLCSSLPAWQPRHVSEASLEDLILKEMIFRRIAFFNVRSSRPMTRFASSYLPFPTANGGELSMGSMGEGFELIFVAVLTSFAADIITGPVDRFFGLIRLGD